MRTIKGKVRICQSKISDFNIEQIANSPFYKRYDEFVRIFNKYLNGQNAELLFAQPLENESEETIDWFIPQEAADAGITSLESLSGTDQYEYYADIRKRFVQQISSIPQTISAMERTFVDCAVVSLDNDYSDQTTYCYNDRVIFSLWGMKMRKGRDPRTVISDDVRERRIHSVEYKVEGRGTIEGKASITRKHGHVLQGNVDIPLVRPALHYKFVKWVPDAPQGKAVLQDMSYVAVCERTDDFTVEFRVLQNGSLAVGSSAIVYKKPGTALVASDIPQVQADDGYRFSGWMPELPLNTPLTDDMVFVAKFEETQEETVMMPEVPKCQVEFNPGQFGTVSGNSVFMLDKGATLRRDDIPIVAAVKNYEFKGWDKNPLMPIMEDTVFLALYEKIPWYRRLWLWILAHRRWLIWLLIFLLALLLLLLLPRVLNSCSGCSSAVHPLPQTTGLDGKLIDDNGVTLPIGGDLGQLPDGIGVVAPFRHEDGTDAPIVSQEGMPDIIADRLILFMEDENDDLESLAEDFKKAYPGDEYNIIGYDREVKMLVIMVPEKERANIRETINSKIPGHKFLVFDEEIYELNARTSSLATTHGWHLDAIHLKQGWAITRGDGDVCIAVIDDGIDPDHPMLQGRLVDGYNVYTQNNNVSLGGGHGTHTASLAAGADDFYGQGASGVAPECRLMPVQVFDNDKCPLSALVAGVMYAVHHDADIINVSISPSFRGLNALPVLDQNHIADTAFKNVESLWTRICELAARKNSILVFAAGNDDILSSIPPENRNRTSIVVTSVDSRLYPTRFTNYGPCSDISAPGTDIFSAYTNSSFQSFSGTSMSAPIVSGTVALMKSLKNDLTVEQAYNVLYKSGQDVYGWVPPMVLVDKALECVKKGDFDAPEERPLTPVPEGESLESSAGNLIDEAARRIVTRPRHTTIVTTPVDVGTVVETSPGVIVTEPVDEVIVETAPEASGEYKVPDTRQTETPGHDDYEEIRRLIREYEAKTRELKKLLPENN